MNWLMGFIVMLLFSLAGLLAYAIRPVAGALTPIIVCLFLSLFFLINYLRNNKTMKDTQPKGKNCLSEVTLKHTTGLPIAENVLCTACHCIDKLLIRCQGASFSLPIERLLNVSMTTDTEIQKSYVSSAGGAVGGALLFGAVGALIGGRTKQKTNRTVTEYLILSYEKDGAPNYLAFEVINHPRTQKFMRSIQPYLGEKEIGIAL